jgi:hypothetical protein
MLDPDITLRRGFSELYDVSSTLHPRNEKSVLAKEVFVYLD